MRSAGVVKGCFAHRRALSNAWKMRIPDSLATLHDQGIIAEVLRPLMSGKEAQIYLVTAGEQRCVAKVYKDAQHRSFKHRAAYTEGRKVRNSRDQRAMVKRTKHGREQEEAAWRSTEVDVIYRLHAGGVRVPIPHHFIDGVLVMELIADAEGNPAPRLGDMTFEPEVATRIYQRLIREVMRMLCAGIVHGDLSDFNVLLGADGPVIIDFPQSVDTAHNGNARQLLLRDVENMHRFLARFVPNARRLPYAEEMWELHQNNALTPDTQLTGRYQAARRQANIGNVLSLIDDANRDERKRRDALGLRGGPPRFEANTRGGAPKNAIGQRAQQPTGVRRSDSQANAAAGRPTANHRRFDVHGVAPNPGRQNNPNHPLVHQTAANHRSQPTTRHAPGSKGPRNVEVIVLRRPAR
jgi:RIO kinase 1